jgi:hypothetical protein
MTGRSSSWVVSRPRSCRAGGVPGLKPWVGSSGSQAPALPHRSCGSTVERGVGMERGSTVERGVGMERGSTVERGVGMERGSTVEHGALRLVPPWNAARHGLVPPWNAKSVQDRPPW